MSLGAKISTQRWLLREVAWQEGTPRDERPQEATLRRREGQETKTPRGLQEAPKRAPKSCLKHDPANILCMGSSDILRMGSKILCMGSSKINPEKTKRPGNLNSIYSWMTIKFKCRACLSTPLSLWCDTWRVCLRALSIEP